MSSNQKPDNFWQRMIKSEWFSKLINLPIISWGVSQVAGVVIRRELKTSKPESKAYYTDSPLTQTKLPDILPQSDEDYLRQIVRSVVEDLDYAAAFLALYEQGDVLPIYAFYINPDIISQRRIVEIEEMISGIMNQKMSLSDPEVARVYVYKKGHEANLSIRAIKARVPVTDKDLFTLFTPIVPESTRPIFASIQKELGVEEVVAVPFTIDYYTKPTEQSQLYRPVRQSDGTVRLARTSEIIGNLFAVSQAAINEKNINVLKAFGAQAATAIQNSQYKKRAEISQELILRLQSTTQNESETFQEIVRVVVEEMYYVGAMIAINDTQNVLRIKATHLAKDAYTDKPTQQWQSDLFKTSKIEVSLHNLNVIDLDLSNNDNSDNLGYQVMQAQEVITSKSLYSLFRPKLPDASRETLEAIQKDMGIVTILAIPLFTYDAKRITETRTNGIGVLYVASRSRGFTAQEVELLKTVGEQVGNVMIFALSEKRRLASERFARMAFNANASLHDINGHIGAIRLALRLMTLPDTEEMKFNNEILEMSQERIIVTSTLLESLTEPFVDADKVEVNLVMSINRALEKLNIDFTTANITTEVTTEGDIPTLIAFHQMFVQIFRIFFKRAMNAIIDLGRSDGKINVHLQHIKANDELLVTITDNGRTMTSEEMSEIFDIHETMQDAIVGFGLFWAHDYVRGMGGRITISSEAKQGTIFNIYIPIRHVRSTQSMLIAQTQESDV